VSYDIYIDRWRMDSRETMSLCDADGDGLLVNLSSLRTPHCKRPWRHIKNLMTTHLPEWDSNQSNQSNQSNLTRTMAGCPET